MKTRKLIILAVCFVMMMSLFSGCKKKIYLSTGLKDNEVFKISDYTCTIGQMNIVLFGIMHEYEEVFGKELWQQSFTKDTAQEKIKSQAFSNMLDLYCLRHMADDENYIITAEEKEAITKATDKFYGGLTAETIENLAIERSDVETLYTCFTLIDNLYTDYTEDIEVELSDSSARVIKVQSIYMKDKALAESVLAEAKAGEDFSTLATKHSEDATVEYIFGRGEMIEAYENAAFKLSIGEISDIIATEDGYYIIKCISDYLENETVKNKEKLIEQYKQNVFMEAYEPVKEKLTYELNNKIWKSMSVTNTNSSVEGFYDCYYEFCG